MPNLQYTKLKVKHVEWDLAMFTSAGDIDYLLWAIKDFTFALDSLRRYFDESA